MTVFRPSFPPAICTTIRIWSLAAIDTRALSIASALADAKPRLKTAGMTIPAETASIPSLSIARRESLISLPPKTTERLIKLVLRRRHKQIERTAHNIERVTLSISQCNLLHIYFSVCGGYSLCLPIGKIIDQLRPAIRLQPSI